MIKEFKVINGALPDDGLTEFVMQRLGNVVVLAGPNGAGKSRILRRLESCLKNRAETRSEIKQLESEILSFENSIKSGKGDIHGMEKELGLKRKRLADRVAKAQSVILANEDKAFIVERFVPDKTTLHDAGSLPPNEVRQRANKMRNFLNTPSSGSRPRMHDTPSISNLNELAMPVIHDVASKQFIASHPGSGRSKSEQEQAQNNINNLNLVLRSLLGTETKMIDTDKVELFGRPFNPSELSQGQSVLLQLAVALFSKGRTFDNMILIMDEPENHLHPSALLDFINRLLNVIGSGQIWIATHSLPLLSNLPESSIYHVQNGKAVFSGNSPELLLDGLIGDRSKLLDFLGRPERLAAIRFACECLVPSSPKMTPPGDSQLRQIHDALPKYGTILDFGAGMGRLFRRLQEADSLQNLQYHAFDIAYRKNAEMRLFVSNLLKQVYAESVNDHIHDSLQPGFTANVVVMCNTLHEIPVSEWLDVLRACYKLLSSNGVLLIVEDLKLVFGELPNPNGFLLLYPIAADALFKKVSYETYFRPYHNVEDRLVCYTLGKECLYEANEESLEDCIRTSKKFALDSIRKIRNQSLPRDYRQGREHALWMQQLSACELHLSREESI